jgi:hypothetical protein
MFNRLTTQPSLFLLDCEIVSFLFEVFYFYFYFFIFLQDYEVCSGSHVFPFASLLKLARCNVTVGKGHV